MGLKLEKVENPCSKLRTTLFKQLLLHGDDVAYELVSTRWCLEYLFSLFAGDEL